VRPSGTGRRPLWVVKLGGSLATSPLLQPWLDALAARGGALVVVPGGGPFADEVRAMQSRCGFDNTTAHHMALLAMEQYGLMLCALAPRLRPAATRAEIARQLADRLVPVWQPTRMALGRKEISESWDMTSDSLAAWLAAELRASLLLVKSAVIPASASLDDLVADGIVDPLLPKFVVRGVPECRFIEAKDYAALGATIPRGRGQARAHPDMMVR
jgi:5-(aminomethyl)-3-furanmethanol phosphate kinase